MAFLSSSQLAPIRLIPRIGASAFALKAPIDLTVLALLEIQREVKALQDSEGAEQETLFFGLVRRIFLDSLPKALPVDDGVTALAAFFAQFKDGPDDDPDDTAEIDYGIVAARLARAYGGGMWQWLSESPVPVFNAAVRLLGPLAAEDNIGQVTVTALGSGLVKKHESSRITHEWERIARQLRRPEKAEALSMDEMKARFALMGMPVEVF